MPTLTQYTADPVLEKIKTGIVLRAISGAVAPVNRADAVTRTLGMATVAPGDFGAITTYGSAEGRAMTGPTVVDLPFTVTGDVTMFCLDDGTDLLHTNGVTGAPISVTSGTSRDVSYGQVRIPFAGTSA